MNWLTIFFIIAFLLYLQMYFYMSKRERKIMSKLKRAHEVAKKHWLEYKITGEYWRGRRDEAEFFTELLIDYILYEDEKAEDKKERNNKK